LTSFKEWFEGLIKGITDPIKDLMDGLTKNIEDQAVKFMKAEIAFNSLDLNKIQDPELKKKMGIMKDSWKNSPESISDIANDLLDVLVGKVAKVQLEHIVDEQFNNDDIISNRLFTQMAVITDISMIAGTLEIVGACVPTTNLQHIGLAIKDYLDYSGLTQATGFGYGMMLSNVVSPQLTQELQRKTRKTILNADEAIRLCRRELITEPKRDDYLNRAGYSDELQTALIAGSEYYPSAADFIQFSVRDTFNDAVVRKYNYDAEFPSSIVPYAKKAGLSEEWLKHYWRAHWELPSATQAFEMLHRGSITLDDARTLLRIADVAPYFIEPLIKTAYTPITRVDIRRLWATGKYDKTWLLARHKDLGYDEINAESMASWIIGDGLAEEKDLTKTEMLSAYKEGSLAKDELVNALISLGYDHNESEIIIGLADYQVEHALVVRERNVAVKEYIKDRMTIKQLTEELHRLNLTEREIALTLREAKIQRAEAL